MWMDTVDGRAYPGRWASNQWRGRVGGMDTVRFRMAVHCGTTMHGARCGVLCDELREQEIADILQSRSSRWILKDLETALVVIGFVMTP